MPISCTRHPRFYAINVERHRLVRTVFSLFGRRRFSRPRRSPVTPYRISRHRSVLIRTLGVFDQRLQKNKVTNLRLAAERINGTVIRPGETFSFWRLVGRPTGRRGFLSGMLLSQGRVIEGVGGGLCQMSNLIYWLLLHTPLTITERYRHGYDIFPDFDRILPFGSGATVFYNYVDLQAINRTPHSFRIGVQVGERFLDGRVWSDADSSRGFRVVERDHRFFRGIDGIWWRENRLFRQTLDRKAAEMTAEELIGHNLVRVMYEYEPEATKVLRNRIS